MLELALPDRPCEIAVAVVAAPEMAALNQRYLNHEGSTDVITFGYGEVDEPGPLMGDLFICIEDAIRQGREFRTSWPAEITRYFIHGVLHLLGHDDLTAEPRRRMKREENRLVRQIAREFALSSLAKPSAAPRSWKRNRRG